MKKHSFLLMLGFFAALLTGCAYRTFKDSPLTRAYEHKISMSKAEAVQVLTPYLRPDSFAGTDYKSTYSIDESGWTITLTKTIAAQRDIALITNPNDRKVGETPNGITVTEPITGAKVVEVPSHLETHTHVNKFSDITGFLLTRGLDNKLEYLEALRADGSYVFQYSLCDEEAPKICSAFLTLCPNVK